MFLIRESTHRRVQRTWIKQTDEEVYRGPFYGVTHQLVLGRYTCLKQLNDDLQLNLKIIIPDTTITEEKTFLVFPKLKTVEWCELTTTEKILIIKMSFIRYVLSCPSNSMDDYLKCKNKLVPINLDGRKMLLSDTLIELLFEKCSTYIHNLSMLIHEQQKELLAFLDELESNSHLSGSGIDNDVANRCNYLRIRLKNKNILKVNIPFERLEGRRGPKMGKKSIEEIKVVSNHHLPSKGTFEHVSVKAKHYSLEEMCISSDYFFSLAETVPLEVFKMYLYQFMLEYLSIKDIEKYLKFAVTETDLNKIYLWITSLEKTQELFELVLSSSINDEVLPTWEDSRDHLGNKYLATMAKTLPYHAPYFYHLTSNWSSGKQYIWKANKKVECTPKTIRFDANLLFRSMLMRRESVDDKSINEPHLNPHLLFDSKLKKYLLKLNHYHLSFTPYNLYKIYH